MNDDRLTQHLNRVAERAPLRHLEMEEVMNRAQGIRRKRRTAAAAGLAVAAVLIAVPVGIGVLDNRDEREGSPVGTPSGTPAPPVTPGTLDITKLKQGAAPKVGYVQGTTLHLGDDTVTLPRAYDQVVVLPHVVIGQTPASEPVVETDVISREDGKVRQTELGWPGLVVNSEQTSAAFLDRDQQPVVIGDDFSVIRMTAFDGESAGGESAPAQILALQGDDCQSSGCMVFADVSDGDNTDPDNTLKTSNTDGEMKAARNSGDLLIASDVGFADTGYSMIGYTEIRDDGTCSTLRVSSADKPAWRTCDVSAVSFSPDSQLVRATPSYGDGIGDGQIGILDAKTGKALIDLRTEPGSFINSTVWEDSTHLLVQVHKDGKWALVRVGADGSTELATAPVAGEDVEAPYRLPVQP